VASDWKDILWLSFSGDRVVKGALDLTALGSLSSFQRLFTETARAAFLAANPSRQRVPKGFEDATRLFLRRVEAGSAVARLELPPSPGQVALRFEDDGVEDYVEKAADITLRAFDAIERDEQLPFEMAWETLASYGEFASSIPEDETITVSLPDRERARSITRATATKIDQRKLPPYEDAFDVVGEVLEVDIKKEKFQLWLNEKARLPLPFSASQESLVTGALRDHASIRLRARGRGRFAGDGELLQVIELAEISDTKATVEAQPTRSLLEELLAISDSISDADRGRLPTNLAENLDGYLYGSPKR
jgi:hypothetical protein